jgi:hypothetical protein
MADKIQPIGKLQRKDENQIIQEIQFSINKDELLTMFKSIDTQTTRICLAAVEKYPDLLKFVKNQTERICLTAVEHDGLSLKYVEKQTEEICLTAVRQNGFALKYVKNQTSKICSDAYLNNYLVFKYVEDKHERACLMAVSRHPSLLRFIDIPSVYVKSVEDSWKNIVYIDNPTEEVCIAAVKQDSQALWLIKNPTDKVIQVARESFLIKHKRHTHVDTQLQKEDLIIEHDLPVNLMKGDITLGYINSLIQDKDTNRNLKSKITELDDMVKKNNEYEFESSKKLIDRTYWDSLG